MDIHRSDFPPQTQLQGMAAQASQWLLKQIELNDLTAYEALKIVLHLQETVVSLVGRDAAEDD